MDPQSRKYQLTINNPIPKGYTSEVLKDRLRALSLDYYCYAFEKGSQEHVHSFLYSHSPIRKRFVNTENDNSLKKSLF